LDAHRFDLLARVLGTTSRRRLLAALAAGLGGHVATSGRTLAADCPRSQRCGGKCCKDCFIRDDPNGGKSTPFCCREDSICRSRQGRRFDQCCYGDERCQPNNPGPEGVCCRNCGGGCCTSSEFCQGGVCTSLGTARLARIRR